MPSFTRKAIMEAFLKILDEKSLGKITIRDIVDECGINRNTFYYHFADIPELLETIIKEETDHVISGHSDVSSFEECLTVAVQYILKNRRAMLHIHNSVNREIMERSLMRLCEYMVRTYLRTAFGELSIVKEDLEALVTAYKCQAFGLLIDWMNSGLNDYFENTLLRLCELRKGTIEEMIARCRRE